MKVPDEFLDRILQNELKRGTWLSRITADLRIATTASFGGHFKLKAGIKEKSFKPAIFSKASLLFLGLLFLALIIREDFILNRVSTIDLLPVYLVTTALLSYAAWRFYNDRSRKISIGLDSNGIRINGTLMMWSDIYETAIVTKPEGKTQKYYLIIAFSDMVFYEVFDLSEYYIFNIWGFAVTLSGYIEYFKSASKEKKRPQLSS